MSALITQSDQQITPALHSAPQIPYFNAGIFLENKTQIGKVEEIFGSINNSVSWCLVCRLCPVFVVGESPVNDFRAA